MDVKGGSGPRGRRISLLARGDQVGPAFPDCAGDCNLRSESDHRVANHLAMLSSYVRLKGADLEKRTPVDDSSLRLFVQGVDAQINAIARLHRLLTHHAKDDAVDLAMLLHEVCAPFANDFDQRFSLVEDLDADCMVRADHILPISQLVGEAIVNAAKYAYSGSISGLLRVRCRRLDASNLLIEVIDTGVGLSPAFDPERDGGFGLRLMRRLSGQLGASLSFTSVGGGLCVGLTLHQDDDMRRMATARRAPLGHEAQG